MIFYTLTMRGTISSGVDMGLDSVFVISYCSMLHVICYLLVKFSYFFIWPIVKICEQFEELQCILFSIQLLEWFVLEGMRYRFSYSPQCVACRHEGVGVMCVYAVCAHTNISMLANFRYTSENMDKNGKKKKAQILRYYDGQEWICFKFENRRIMCLMDHGVLQVGLKSEKTVNV